MQAEKIGLYFEPPVVTADEPARIMYSRAPTVECIPGLGKNIVPLKIRLHQRIKDDLQLLADRAGIPLSQFVREILISHFFGQTFWSDRLQKWTKEQEHIATEWEQGLREANICLYSQDCGDEIDGDLVVERLEKTIFYFLGEGGKTPPPILWSGECLKGAGVFPRSFL